MFKHFIIEQNIYVSEIPLMLQGTNRLTAALLHIKGST